MRIYERKVNWVRLRVFQLALTFVILSLGKLILKTLFFFFPQQKNAYSNYLIIYFRKKKKIKVEICKFELIILNSLIFSRWSMKFDLTRSCPTHHVYPHDSFVDSRFCFLVNIFQTWWSVSNGFSSFHFLTITITIIIINSH